MEDNSHLFKPFTHDELVRQAIIEAIKIDDVTSLKDNWKYSPKSQSGLDAYLRGASHHGSAKCIDYLAKQGADVHNDESTCLLRALKSGNNSAVDVLLNHGADIHARNNGPVRYAAVHDDKELAEIIFVKQKLKVTPDIQKILTEHDCPQVNSVIRARDLHDKLHSEVKPKHQINQSRNLKI